MSRNIKAISGEEPHPSHGGWEKFLATCDIRGEADGVIFYGSSNCNYLVFPGGELIENYGYHGPALLDRVGKEGADAVLRDLLQRRGKTKCFDKNSDPYPSDHCDMTGGCNAK